MELNGICLAGMLTPHISSRVERIMEFSEELMEFSLDHD